VPAPKVALLSAIQNESSASQAPDLVTKDVVARDCGVCNRTIESWVAQRRIPFVRLGHRTLRFRLADVRRAISRWATKEVV
jgi:excisionase family DNA binding protein